MNSGTKNLYECIWTRFGSKLTHILIMAPRRSIFTTIRCRKAFTELWLC